MMITGLRALRTSAVQAAMALDTNIWGKGRGFELEEPTMVPGWGWRKAHSQKRGGRVAGAAQPRVVRSRRQGTARAQLGQDRAHTP